MAENKRIVFRCEWLKIICRRDAARPLCRWSLPKKYIPRAVDRNRLKRYGRENLKKIGLRGVCLTVVFLPANRSFYRTLRRRDFDRVFQKLAEKMPKDGG